MSGGAITFPSIGCRVYNSANISTSDGANKTLTFDSERYDNGDLHYTSAAALTGTVDKTASSATLVGTGTAFLSELSVGQAIVVPGTANELRVVIAIASNTSLTVNSSFANNASGQTATRDNSVLVARCPGKYMIFGHVEFDANAIGQRALFVQLNENQRISYQTVDAAASGTTRLEVSTIYALSQWDIIQLRAFQNSTGALNVATQNNWSPEFGMSKLHD